MSKKREKEINIDIYSNQSSDRMFPQNSVQFQTNLKSPEKFRNRNLA